MLGAITYDAYYYAEKNNLLQGYFHEKQGCVQLQTVLEAHLSMKHNSENSSCGK